ncbi:MAG: SIS domain-containing protein [Cellvibrionaceae bacterium]|nr:SIS domain-containing protein [Cellvibrionaceae bacterium]
MNQDSLYKTFQNSIEATMEAGETLLPDIVDASSMIVNSLLEEGKIFTCGNGCSAGLAQIFTNNLCNGFERERPSLPSLTLGCNLSNITSTANKQTYNDIFAREVRALGNRHDILVVISASGKPLNLIQAVQAAHERDMTVIALNGQDGGNIAAVCDVNDKELRVPSTTRSRIHEVHLLIIFCLCELIDEQLFGFQAS